MYCFIFTRSVKLLVTAYGTTTKHHTYDAVLTIVMTVSHSLNFKRNWYRRFTKSNVSSFVVKDVYSGILCDWAHPKIVQQ
jgi:hypothetical protein